MWIQVHGLPWNRLRECIGLKLGRLLEIDKLEYRDHDRSPFLRLRVELNLRHPLVGGFPIPRKQFQPLWVQFRYEKVAYFCYACGLIGHIQKHCRTPPSSVELLGVGPPMRAEPATMRKATSSKGLLSAPLLHGVQPLSITPSYNDKGKVPIPALPIINVSNVGFAIPLASTDCIYA